MEKLISTIILLLIAAATQPVFGRQINEQDPIPLPLPEPVPDDDGDIIFGDSDGLPSVDGPPGVNDRFDPFEPVVHMDAHPTLPPIVFDFSEPEDRTDVHPPSPPPLDRFDIFEPEAGTAVHHTVPPVIDRMDSSGPEVLPEILPPAPPSFDRVGSSGPGVLPEILPPAPPSFDRSDSFEPRILPGIHPPAPPSHKRIEAHPPAPPSHERSGPSDPFNSLVTIPALSNVDGASKRACVYIHMGKGHFLTECRDISDQCEKQACGEDKVCGVNLHDEIQCFDNSVRSFQNCQNDVFRLQQPCPADSGIVGFGQGCTFCIGGLFIP